MSYLTEHFLPHVRIALLRVLADAPGYAANDSVLVSALGALGLVVSRDILRGQLAWLAEQGLITTASPSETLTVATIVERGTDVARGLAIVPGVQRPSPGQ